MRIVVGRFAHVCAVASVEASLRQRDHCFFEDAKVGSGESELVDLSNSALSGHRARDGRDTASSIETPRSLSSASNDRDSGTDARTAGPLLSLRRT